jgi:cell division protein FtsB
MTVNGIKAENTELRQEVARLDEALATEMRRSANLASEKADYRVQYSKLRDVCRAQEDEIARLTAENEKLRAAMELFACDCKGEELCFNTDNCRNFIARTALSGDKP